MAICLAVQKWRCYLLGRHFIVKADQQSLRFIMQQREVGVEYQKWVTKLLGYSFEVQLKPGSANRVVDALSWKSETKTELCSLLSSSEVDWTKLEEEVQKGTTLSKIRQEMRADSTSHPGFSLQEGRLFFKNWLVIPRTSFFVPVLLRLYHSSPMGGHSGDTKTYLRVAV